MKFHCMCISYINWCNEWVRAFTICRRRQYGQKLQYARDEWWFCEARKRHIYLCESIVQAFALDAYLYVHLILLHVVLPSAVQLSRNSFFSSKKKNRPNPLRKAGKIYGRHRVLSSSSSLLSLFHSFFLLLSLAVSNKKFLN